MVDTNTNANTDTDADSQGVFTATVWHSLDGSLGSFTTPDDNGGQAVAYETGSMVKIIVNQDIPHAVSMEKSWGGRVYLVVQFNPPEWFNFPG